MKLNHKNILILIFIFCIAVILVYIFITQPDEWKEAVYPIIKQKYIAKNPNTGRAILYIKMMQCLPDEGKWTTLVFRGIDGEVYYMDIQHSDSPDLWILSGNRDFTELIPIKEVQHYDDNSVDIEF